MPDDYCAMHQQIDHALQNIGVKLDAILSRLGTGDVQLALISQRLTEAEKKINWLFGLVAGIAGVVGLAVLGAILKMVIG